MNDSEQCITDMTASQWVDYIASAPNSTIQLLRRVERLEEEVWLLKTALYNKAIDDLHKMTSGTNAEGE